MTKKLPAPGKLAQLTKLSLNNAGLPEFPEQLFAAKQLRSLDAFRAIARDGDASVPAEIAKLRSLEQLILGGNATRKLPPEIGKLSKLQVLALDYCAELQSLPKTIGKLTKLRELSLAYTGKLRALPAEIGGLSKLESLALPESGIEKIPATLWKCTKLQSLVLPNGVTKLPRGISKLRELRALRLSPAALWSIEKELPKLTELEVLSLSVCGSARTLPESIGQIPNLKVLELAYIQLESLPEGLLGHATLKQLDVAGNKLETLIEMVRSLPKLRELGYSENPLPLEEKREIQALMQLPPSKRGKFKPKVAAAPTSKPELLGKVVSINAYLAMVIVDGELGKAWTGIGDGPSPGADWDRASKALHKREAASLDIGDGSGAVVVLGVWQGIVHVFRVGERVTFVESFCEDLGDPLFLEWIASEPIKQAKSVAKVEVASGKLAMAPTTNTTDSDESLTLELASGSYSLLLEPGIERAWGSGRRGHLLRL